MKFRTKTILGVAVIELILLGILTLNFISMLRDSNQEEALRKVKLTESLMIAASEDAVISYDIATLQSLADNVIQTQELAYVRFWDNDYNILVESWLLDEKTASDFYRSSETLHRTIPIEVSGQISGYVQFGIDQGYMANLLNTAINQTVSLAVFEILLVAAFSALLGVYLTNQLTGLTLASNKIREGNLGFKLPVRGNDELSETVQAFNTMSTTLKRLEIQRLQEKEKLEIAHQRMRSLLDNFPFLIWLKNNDGQFLSVNKAFADACGKHNPESVEGLTDFDVWPTDLANQYRIDDLKVINSAKGKVVEEKVESEGERIWIETFKSPVVHHDKVIGTVGFARDVSERKEAAERQRKAEAIFNSASEAILLADAYANVKMINPAFTQITGYEEDEILGQNASILSSGQHDKEFYQIMYAALETEGSWQGEIHNRKKNGELYVQWQTIVALKGEHGQVEEYLAIFSDITQKKAAEDEIKYRANYDQLTGLPNRTLLNELLKQELLRSHRESKKSAVMFLDLDHFKRINDTLGHAIGDLLLQKVSELLQTTIRDSDVVARLGGDEFIVILSDVDNVTDISAVAEKIVTSLGTPIHIHEHEIRTCTSIGIAVFPEDGRDEEELLSHADMAMYKAKESGRGQYRFFNTEMAKEIRSSRSIELELSNVIENEELCVAFQPIVNISDHSICGYEALMRWPEQTNQKVSVEQSIRNAEEFGLIQPLFEVVFNKAAQGFSQLLKDSATADLYFTVNVSSHQIPDRLSLDWVVQRLADYGLSPQHLIIELTEGVFLSDSPENLRWLKRAREMGIRISLDDFGTGYSSLAYLKRFTVDFLKIDRGFVANLQQTGADYSLIKSVISLSDAFGLTVIAEGVETEEQAQVLAELGCEAAQGYFYGKPKLVQLSEAESIS
ncbi:EAL domain-containing protein [Neptuniibacter sp. QD48_55]|uniref:EAL domain-containing protein n=1 Tax=Neptuniibacter sp. QD48_55 TaxID=3398212 RepID=UPI0039F454DD